MRVFYAVGEPTRERRLGRRYHMMTFTEFVAIREGLLSIKPPAGGLSRVNPFPTTSAHIKRIRTLAKPTVRPVPVVVPKIGR